MNNLNTVKKQNSVDRLENCFGHLGVNFNVQTLWNQTLNFVLLVTLASRTVNK